MGMGLQEHGAAGAWGCRSMGLREHGGKGGTALIFI